MYLFIYFWLLWVFVAVRGLSLVAASGGYSSLWCMGFSLQWLLLLWSTGSRHAGFSSCGSWALECRLSSCGAQASLLHSMWDLPRPGLEPTYPALAGGFLTTAPPGKSQIQTLNSLKHTRFFHPHSPSPSPGYHSLSSKLLQILLICHSIYILTIPIYLSQVSKAIFFQWKTDTFLFHIVQWFPVSPEFMTRNTRFSLIFHSLNKCLLT